MSKAKQGITEEERFRRKLEKQVAEYERLYGGHANVSVPKILDGPRPAGGPKKIAIVGAAPSSFGLAPFNDQSWEIWGCSPSNNGKFPRITSWFELHDIHFLKHAKQASWAQPYGEWLKSRTFRVVMQCENDIAPQAFVYPWEAAKALCPYGAYMLTSSIAQMIALAIIEGADEIALYGVDMAADSEWGYELPGCQIWVARARERGIKVYVPDDSSLDQPIPIYGLDDATPMARKMREQVGELIQRRGGNENELNSIDARKTLLLREHYVLDGAIDALNWARKTFVSWSGPDSA